MKQHRIHIQEVWGDEPQEDEEGEHPKTRPDSWPDPVSGTALVKSITDMLKRHVVMQHSEQYLACALWILHAHCHDAARHSPILLVTSPEPECGKSTLLRDCISNLVPRSWYTDLPTPASIYDEIQYGSTIIADEFENYGCGDKNMTAIFNGSWDGPDAARTVKGVRYPLWGPKAIGLNRSIGKLHPTTEGRSININVERKTDDEPWEPFKKPKDRYDDTAPVNIIRMKCVRWARDNLDKLRQSEPDLPSELGSNRIKENWLPLVAIADLCGPPYGKHARAAAVAITRRQHGLQELSLGPQLIRHIKQLYGGHEPIYPSKDLVADLLEIEGGPWKRQPHNKPLNTTSLSILLKPYEIRPREERLRGRRAQCYRIEQFVEAFRRYGQSPKHPRHTRHPRNTQPRKPAGKALVRKKPKGQVRA
jgi:hypothetical protein